MKKRIILAAMTTSMLVYMLSSCYQNKEDIIALPKVSFRAEVVPIVTAGPCGCHNNGIGTRAVQFSHYDTVFYDAILSRRSYLDSMSRLVGKHPGGGGIEFADNERNIIKKWIAQGDPYDDGAGCTVSGTIRYTADILPLYTTSCKGATCHGGIAIALDYNKLVAEKTTLTTIMNTGGSQGHPGGPLSLTTCTINKFKEWINQGQPQ
ncbi:MAG: hypothetical protein IPP02_09085 [Chitinophagaceae bacterium]|jgi:hypothetical protein|nr:hypothetical protein [Chitinophagaceae bacterium]MBK7677997.1 hypothetical protein [Chitinophagaceae bacterium]MBK8301313.1 hypothetical protein [Chitinophagaceae bacterium]MBK9466166.1 hypothetical protein [Chitinophagaceae bacterium]MBK9658357.1 hypothetical protein [Chitinophagaceae bacterium]